MAEAIFSPEFMFGVPSSTSPRPTCAICLGTSEDKCHSNTCTHEYCFECLLAWSKVKAECPLCKRRFSTIVHNFTLEGYYDEYHVPVVMLRGPSNYENDANFNMGIPMFASSSVPLSYLDSTVPPELSGSIGPFYRYYTPVSTPPRIRSPERITLRERLDQVPVCRENQGFNDSITPEMLRDTAMVRSHVFNWLHNNIASYHIEADRIDTFVAQILQFVMLHRVSSEEFSLYMTDQFGQRAAAFIKEFCKFLTRLARTITLDISDYESDSDVVVVADYSNERPEVIDLLLTDSDEPIFIDEIPGTSKEKSKVLPLKLRLHNNRRKRQWTCEGRNRSPSSSSSSCYEYEERSYRRYKKKKKSSKKILSKSKTKSDATKSLADLEAIRLDLLASNEKCKNASRQIKLLEKEKQKLERTREREKRRIRKQTGLLNQAKDCARVAENIGERDTCVSNSAPLNLSASPLNLVVGKCSMSMVCDGAPLEAPSSKLGGGLSHSISEYIKHFPWTYTSSPCFYNIPPEDIREINQAVDMTCAPTDHLRSSGLTECLALPFKQELKRLCETITSAPKEEPTSDSSSLQHSSDVRDEISSPNFGEPSTSSGKVRSLLIRKMTSTNEWYSRPLPSFDSDSSDD